MENAINKMNLFLSSKTVHSTKSITDFMQAVVDNTTFSSEAVKREFIYKCNQFKDFSNSSGKSSWGRKQVVQWWDTATVTPDPEVYNYTTAYLPLFEEVPKTTSEAEPTYEVEYEFEVLHQRIDTGKLIPKMSELVPRMKLGNGTVPPWYGEGASLSINETCYRVMDTLVSITTENGMLKKISHQVRVK